MLRHSQSWFKVKRAGKKHMFQGQNQPISTVPGEDFPATPVNLHWSGNFRGCSHPSRDFTQTPVSSVSMFPREAPYFQAQKIIQKSSKIRWGGPLQIHGEDYPQGPSCLSAASLELRRLASRLDIWPGTGRCVQAPPEGAAGGWAGGWGMPRGLVGWGSLNKRSLMVK